MPKRFSRYNFALKAVDGAAPAGSPLGRFKDYKSGTTKPTYPRGAGSNPGELIQAYLIPFATTEDDSYAIQYSKRARDEAGELGVSDSILRIEVNSAPVGALFNPGFTPARATIQKRGSGSSATISKITGVSYQKASGAASFTYPFGRAGASGATSRFWGVAKAIKDAVEAKQSRNSVSFQPENFRL